MADQKTIKKEVCFSGGALQTGREVNVSCKGADPGAGIVFKRSDIPDSEALRLGSAVFSNSFERRSTIGIGSEGVQTVEHLLAALWALEIDNIFIELDGEELPAMDGSAIGFLEPLKAAGIVHQEIPRQVIKIKETHRIEEGDSLLEVSPDETFSVSYFIEYNVPSIGREVFDIDLRKKDIFEKEIAPARTFCLKNEAEALLAAGLGKGATYENTLVMDDTGPIQTKLRFKNEPVRHKILDLVGDFYMLGRPIIGKVTARKSGHALNARMVKEIYNKYAVEN